ncbi:MAG: regulatory protein RecX [Deltaproteobacteria bacterium]|nr:regulatory protein RecX [Deltaproteobacteria bacterium]
MKNPQSLIRNSQSLLTPLDYAYRLLARRAHSEQALADKLLSKGFTEHAVARTVARLKEQGYLNDESLAVDQTERLSKKGFGAEGIRVKLRQKGLASDTIEQTLEEHEKAEDLESARKLLASRFSADALKQSQQYARAFRLLLRRGYTQEVVESLLGEAPTNARETDLED